MNHTQGQYFALCITGCLKKVGIILTNTVFDKDMSVTLIISIDNINSFHNTSYQSNQNLRICIFCILSKRQHTFFYLLQIMDSGLVILSVFIQLKHQALCFSQFFRHSLNVFLKIAMNTLINLTHIFRLRNNIRM